MLTEELREIQPAEGDEREAVYPPRTNEREPERQQDEQIHRRRDGEARPVT